MISYSAIIHPEYHHSMLFFPERVARVPVSLWGSGGWGCVRSTLRLRPQPSATVRNRPQPSARGPYGHAYGKFCKRGHFWRFQTSRCFVSRGRRGALWRSDVFRSCVWKRVESHFVWQTQYSTLYTLHSTLCTLHSTLHTLRFTLHTWHFTFHITFHTPHFTLYTPLFCIPQSTVRWHGNSGNMNKIVQLICFTKVLYFTAFGFVGCMLLLCNL